eukprot:SAG22_NODE_19257_length_276_cov_1.152542_1_plen_42_part_10
MDQQALKKSLQKLADTSHVDSILHAVCWIVIHKETIHDGSWH